VSVPQLLLAQRGSLPDSAIEIRLSEWDIATADDDGDDKHAHDAQKVAHNRSWDDLDLVGPQSSMELLSRNRRPARHILLLVHYPSKRMRWDAV
jgi:hypothetical protein